MATKENITLDEAVVKSKGMDHTSYLWLVHENVLGEEIPQDYSFGSLGVVWHSYNEHYTASVELHPANENGYEAMLSLKDNPKYFENLDELRNAFPKLFEVQGEFRGLTR